MPFDELLLLGTAMAISAIPTGMPAFVSGLLSLGAKQLAEAKAVVKNLTDVETLGATSAINTDKTGTLTMNEMMVSAIYAGRRLVHGRGRGLPQDRRDHVGRRACRCPTSPGWRSGWCSTATRRSPTTARSSATRPRPRWSCWRPSSASTPRRRAAPTRGSPRCRSTPTTSSWPRSTASPSTGVEHVIELVKGGPDVVLARCTRVRRPAQRLAGADRRTRARSIDAANERMGEKGLRVLAFAARLIDDDELDGDDRRPDVADPATSPSSAWRASSTRCAPRRRTRCTIALAAGIDVRMITGDHAVTAGAIGADARARAGRDQRHRAAGAVRRGARRAGCPSCTCSAGSRRRTSCASRA